jgi:hypothetical protein
MSAFEQENFVSLLRLVEWFVSYIIAKDIATLKRGIKDNAFPGFKT